MTEPRDLWLEQMSLICAMDKHAECSREECSCWCHGGVREPRRPSPNAGHAAEVTTT